MSSKCQQPQHLVDWWRGSAVHRVRVTGLQSPHLSRNCPLLLGSCPPSPVVLQIEEVYQTVYPAAKPDGHGTFTTENALVSLHALGKQRTPVLADMQVTYCPFADPSPSEPLPGVVTKSL